MNEAGTSGDNAGRDEFSGPDAGWKPRTEAPVPEVGEPTKRGIFLSTGIGYAIIVSSLVVVGLALHHNLRAIEGTIERVFLVEEPTVAAAHEMEINVLGTGLAVWKYLATGAPEHRERVTKDKSDYRQFKAEYERLATTAVEKDLGQRLDALYEPYARLCDALMERQDEFVAQLRRATEGIDAIDAILDDSIQARIGSDAPDGAGKLLASMALEADVAECVASLAAYVVDPAPGHRELLSASIAEAHVQLAAFSGLELTPEERVQAEGIQRLLEPAGTLIEQAAASHEALLRDGTTFADVRHGLDELLDEGIQVLAAQELGTAHPEAKAAIRRLHAGSLSVLALGALVCLGAAGLLAFRSVQLHSANRGLRLEFARRSHAETARIRLLHELVSAQEKERSRLARELHDQMSQDLSALLLGLKSLSSPAPFGPQAPAARAELLRLQELGRRLIEQVHTIAWELRPVALDDRGLHGALGQHLEDWTERSGVEVDFESNLGERRLPEPVEIALYRIAQEALTNVLKHARARNVSLTLLGDAREVVMVVEDDGVGFAPAELPYGSTGKDHLGVSGMKERTALVGGELQLESAPGRGATLVVRIPLS